MSVFVDRIKIAHSYRDYLNFLKEMGEMIEIDNEVDPYLEIGAIVRRYS